MGGQFQLRNARQFQREYGTMVIEKIAEKRRSDCGKVVWKTTEKGRERGQEV